MQRTFFTEDRAVVHEACEAMFERRDVRPIPVEDIGGNWCAFGRVLGIKSIDGAEYRFQIVVSDSRPTGDPT